MMSARKFILLISAIAAVILGLERIGVFRFIPEGDVHFESQSLLNPARLVLSNDAGDLNCWLRLVIRAPTAKPIAPSLINWSGDNLAIAARSLGTGRYELLLSKHPTPPTSTPFVWHTGVPLEITLNDAGAAPMLLEDWELFRTDHESDSHQKALQRWWWTRISWGLLVLSLFGTAITVWQEKEDREVITTRTLVKTIIVNIEGHTREETRKIRRFLTQILLLEFSVAEALDAAQLAGSNKIVRGSFQSRATSLFVQRVALVRQELDRYIGYLAP
jgi:hypothetical protein